MENYDKLTEFEKKFLSIMAPDKTTTEMAKELDVERKKVGNVIMRLRAKGFVPIFKSQKRSAINKDLGPHIYENGKGNYVFRKQINGKQIQKFSTDLEFLKKFRENVLSSDKNIQEKTLKPKITKLSLPNAEAVNVIFDNPKEEKPKNSKFTVIISEDKSILDSIIGGLK